MIRKITHARQADVWMQHSASYSAFILLYYSKQDAVSSFVFSLLLHHIIHPPNKIGDKIFTYPTRIALSAVNRLLKYKVASTENAIEYGFKGLVSSVPEEI